MTVIKAIGPPGSVPFIAFCLLIGLLLAYVWPRQGRLARAWLWLVFAFHAILALPFVANGIAGRLPAVHAAEVAPVRGIDMLFVFDGDNRRGRVRSAVDAARGSPGARVMILGGNGWLSDALAEAGIGRERITQDHVPVDTRQQIDEVRRLTAPNPAAKAAIVASRLQMPRVSRLVRKAGLPAALIVSPIDNEPPTSGWRFVVPTYYALRVSRDAIYEHAALALYTWRGWI
jgi:uncharacterized SAM-binding protein YcdF (DUF218 family)